MHWSETLTGTHRAVWDRLVRGARDRRARARHPTLATVGLGGGAEARTVVLRAADRAAATVEIHTDTLSAKIAELRAEPRATLHVWDARARLQIRLRVAIEILEGPDALDAWARVPEAARLSYGASPPPGRPIAAPDAHAPAADPARFARLLARVEAIDTLHLGAERHARAIFRREDGFAGRWLAP